MRCQFVLHVRYQYVLHRDVNWSTREVSVRITREMSIGVHVGCQFVLHTRCNFRLEKRSFVNVLIRAFVICQFWCTSISPCQNAKIRNLSIYGFGTCSVIESFSPIFKSFRLTPKRFPVLKTVIFFIRYKETL